MIPSPNHFINNTLLVVAFFDIIIFMWEASTKLPEMRVAAITAAFAAGILAASYLPLFAVFGICILFVAAGFLVSRDKAPIIILSALFLLGACRFLLHMQIPLTDISRVKARIIAFEGIIAEDPDARPTGTRLLLRADRVLLQNGWHRISGLVMVNIKLSDDNDLRLSYGDRLKISAHPYQPFAPTNPGQFSYKDYLARQGIHMCATVKRPDQMEVESTSTDKTLSKAAIAAKNYIAGSIQRIHPKEEAAVIIGMLLGTYSYLPKDTFDNFSRTGTLHLLAASGFNCLILVILFDPVLKLLGLSRNWRSITIIALLVFYVMMVGTMPSLIRATIMLGLWLLAVPLGRVPNTKNLFFTSALVTLAVRPSDLFDVGFQLSFAAVWALISSSSIIEGSLQTIGLMNAPRRTQKSGRLQRLLRTALIKVKREIISTAIATVTVSLYTAPIVAYYFNNVSLVSLPANVAVALSVYAVSAVGLISIVAAHIPYVGSLVGFIGTKVTDSILTTVNYLGSGRYSAITVATPQPLAIIGYYVLLIAGINYLRSFNAER